MNTHASSATASRSSKLAESGYPPRKEHAHHAVALRGPRDDAPQAPAVLVDIEADDFVSALQSAVVNTAWPRFGWPVGLSIPMLSTSGAPRALFQPIHRRFNLVLLDTHCTRFGSPRLDPKKIESSGFVVRRWVGPDARAGMNGNANFQDPANWLAWQVRDGQPLGWKAIADVSTFDADPDPKRRPVPRTGNPVVDARLAAMRTATPAEAENKLFVLPPDVCNTARRTLLFGVLPTSEAMRTTRVSAVDYTSARSPGNDRNNFLAHLSPWLQRQSLRLFPVASSGAASFDATWFDDEVPVDPNLPDDANADLQRAQFVAFIRQLALEFDITGSNTTGESTAITAARAQLVARLAELPVGRTFNIPVPNQYQAPYGVGITMQAMHVQTGTADAVLLACARVLVDPQSAAVDLPEDFGPVPAGWFDRFANAALDLLDARSAASPTLEGRFDDASALYAVRAFVRVKGDGACPTRIVWSDFTPLYAIAPWHASTGSPLARISMPALDRASLAAMKPNVAFELPPALASMLARNSPKDLLAGKGKEGDSLGIGWVCSFSIPIITICAFIALNIILGLLDIFLRWIPLVKICLPVPKKN